MNVNVCANRNSDDVGFDAAATNSHLPHSFYRRADTNEYGGRNDDDNVMYCDDQQQQQQQRQRRNNDNADNNDHDKYDEMEEPIRELAQQAQKMQKTYKGLLRNYMSNRASHANVAGPQKGRPSITADELRDNDEILVNVPSILVNVDESRNHDSISNVYVLKRSDLDLLNEFVFDIEIDSSNYKNLDVFRRLMAEVQKRELPENNIDTPLQYIVQLIELITDRQLDGDFVNVATNPICFDMIREYRCDELGLLIEAKPLSSPINGRVYFYSQLAHPQYDELRVQIKKQCNETVYNQFQYIVQRFADTLLFSPGRQVRFTSKIINICIFFILISQLGEPVLDRSFVSAYINLIGYMVDCIVRTRVITNWQMYPCTRQLLSEIVTNYDKRNEVVKICRMKDYRERIEYLLNLVKSNSDKHRQWVMSLSCADFTRILEEQVISVRETGERYYFFNYDFVQSFINNDGIKSLVDQASTIK